MFGKYKEHLGIPAIPHKYKIVSQIPENATTMTILKKHKIQQNIRATIMPKNMWIYKDKIQNIRSIQHKIQTIHKHNEGTKYQGTCNDTKHITPYNTITYRIHVREKHNTIIVQNTKYKLPTYKNINVQYKIPEIQKYKKTPIHNTDIQILHNTKYNNT